MPKTTLLILLFCCIYGFPLDAKEQTITFRYTHQSQDSLPPGSAQTPPTPQNLFDADANIEISGLIIDDTRSKAGRDFYDLFYTQWQPSEDFATYTITIKESPAFGRNTSVSIELNDELVARRFLQPRADIIEQEVENAIQILNAHIARQGSLQQQLESEDEAGSGIY